PAHPASKEATAIVFQLDISTSSVPTGLKMTSRLKRCAKKSAKDLTEDEVQKAVERRAILHHLGPEDRALPGADHEAPQLLRRLPARNGSFFLRLADHPRDHVAPALQRLAHPLADQRALRRQLGAEVSHQAPGGKSALDHQFHARLEVLPQPAQRRRPFVA